MLNRKSKAVLIVDVVASLIMIGASAHTLGAGFAKLYFSSTELFTK